MTDQDAPLFPEGIGHLLSAILSPPVQDGPPYVHTYQPPEPEPRRCPCGHPLDADGDPDQYGCLNGRIYGPCGGECCNGICDDNAGFCQDADGCCDPRIDDD